ncbi:MAG: ribosome silencing factor [Deltaproteobacteria bacterium]|nr:ribosome silencing factor [Deltaproteobacteria bacterium]
MTTRKSPADSPATLSSPKDPKTLAMAITEAAWSKNAYDTRVLDVSNIASFTDMFVILSGRSDRHVIAISAEIEKALKTKRILPSGVEGRQSGTWILMDYGDVVVHVFEKSVREFYELEKLWTDAVEIPVTEPQWVKDFERMENQPETW